MNRAMRDLEAAGLVGLRVLERDQFDTIPPVKWLVQGLITTGFSIIYGAPSAAKSLLALDWALHCTTGTPWFKRAVEHRKALYIAAEGASGITRRVNAWETDRHERAKDFEVVPQVVNLLDRGQVSALDDAVGEHESKVLVVDTLSRSIPGGDENAAQDMGRVVHALTEIQQAHDCAILLIHHSGVEGRRPRGSTALFGAADTVVRVEKAGGMVKVTCEKQKDDDAFLPWSLCFKSVESSVVLTLTGGKSPSELRGQVIYRLNNSKVGCSWSELVKASSNETVKAMVDAGEIVQVNGTNGARYVKRGPQQVMEEAW